MVNRSYPKKTSWISSNFIIMILSLGFPDMTTLTRFISNIMDFPEGTLPHSLRTWKLVFGSQLGGYPKIYNNYGGLLLFWISSWLITQSVLWGFCKELAHCSKTEVAQ
jgi:hypothetical protein